LSVEETPTRIAVQKQQCLARFFIDVVDPIPIEIDKTILDREKVRRYLKGYALHKPV
jgi:hypothetical protein